HFIRSAMAQTAEEFVTRERTCCQLADRARQISVRIRLRSLAQFGQHGSRPFCSKRLGDVLLQHLPRKLGEESRLEALPGEFNQGPVHPRLESANQCWAIEFRQVFLVCSLDVGRERRDDLLAKLGRECLTCRGDLRRNSE